MPELNKYEISPTSKYNTISAHFNENLRLPDDKDMFNQVKSKSFKVPPEVLAHLVGKHWIRSPVT